MDNNGDLASAVSSGGIILKQPGRVGQVYHLITLSIVFPSPPPHPTSPPIALRLHNTDVDVGQRTVPISM